MTISRTNVTIVGSVFNDTQKVLSLPETIKEKSTFRAKALCRELAVHVASCMTFDNTGQYRLDIFPVKNVNNVLRGLFVLMHKILSTEFTSNQISNSI